VVLTEADITQEFYRGDGGARSAGEVLLLVPGGRRRMGNAGFDTDLHGGLWQTWTQIAAEALCWPRFSLPGFR